MKHQISAVNKVRLTRQVYYETKHSEKEPVYQYGCITKIDDLNIIGTCMEKYSDRFGNNLKICHGRFI